MWATYVTDLGSVIWRMLLTVEEPNLIPQPIQGEYLSGNWKNCQQGILQKRAIIATTSTGEFKIEIPISSADPRWNSVIDWYRNNANVLQFEVRGETLVHWYVEQLV